MERFSTFFVKKCTNFHTKLLQKKENYVKIKRIILHERKPIIMIVSISKTELAERIDKNYNRLLAPYYQIEEIYQAPEADWPLGYLKGEETEDGQGFLLDGVPQRED